MNKLVTIILILSLSFALCSCGSNKYSSIGITSDNWSDYFEVKEIASYDVFGELSSIDYFMVPKEEYIDRIAFDNDFRVDFKYKADSSSEASYSVEVAQDGTIIYSEKLKNDGQWMKTTTTGILSMTNHDLSIAVSHVYNANGLAPQLIVSSPVQQDNGVSFCNRYDIEIEAVQGSLMFLG